MTPIVIGIAGGSCSGKTTLSGRVFELAGEGKCTLLRQDDYYIDVSILSPKSSSGGALPNFDAPNAIEFSLLAQHLAALKNGKPAEVPSYDFTTHTRNGYTTSVKPKPLIVIEGMLILHEAEIRALLDHSVFIECAEELRLNRRLTRDVTERGRSRQSVLDQFETTVEPSHKSYVEPSKKYASRIIGQAEYLENQNLASELIQQWTGWQI